VKDKTNPGSPVFETFPSYSIFKAMIDVKSQQTLLQIILANSVNFL